ncbi:N-6 DNA methylase [Chryseobacterium sp. HSC-36S06]|uniref:Eco57I restriction-modification methylase domain-containing protein n=1 Tax=Chryseobacterium sp. HSC-36S06 TaxID=2910970 RepID=UPI00209F6B8A|nr:N-6 DNA methylase [Chryseobacterium sp. HSC-36S06]MCP2037327.1 hypothetical protein [Chryseobacterium sp. HSC-36S06]
MSLFQKTVISKYLKTQNQESISKKWELFREHFHNATIQENIRSSKEEQYQGEFLIDLFVNVLGYIKNPTPNFNLTTEYKNVKDSKKADGAIIISDDVVGIIELKGTNTTDLSKIEDQAFGYKNNQLNCKYVITSNFEKLRLYIDNAIEHIEFNLFELNQEQFSLLYLCLGYENIQQNIPGKIKDESLSQEDAITKKLYKDYSVFKRELFQNLTAQNPQYDALELFQKSQKLLDRLLFLFFGEDRGLLPPNSVRLILEDWNDLQDRDEYVPLYRRFKKYFEYLNTGFKGKRYDVFAYNGGLFKPDEILDHITIDDQLLFKHASKLSEYDFASEVDVNILGHIFENSLNEIDEIKAQLDGQEIDKSKTKRKKDGVFYTPKYITKYIVENTVGKLCEEKKSEFGIIEEEYFTDKKRQLKTKENLLGKLNTYRQWLHHLTIVDPACGSGAFLNEALNFLITEHNYVDELETKLTGSSFTFTYHSESILENNLFGVDLNEESVEIAKLSLWLRTAEPNRKLNNLNDNIKCGNSLIDDSEIAGDKAFHWQEEFPHIFAKGGFDVVIGNPPYLRVQGLRENFEKETKFYEENYNSATGRFDVYVLFLEKSYSLINSRGIVSFILPHKFLISEFGEGIRKFFVETRAVQSIIHFGSEMVFADASTYTCIINLGGSNANLLFKQISPNKIFDSFLFETIDYNSLTSSKWNLNSSATDNLLKKILHQPLTVKDVFENISQGIVSVGDDIFLMKGKIIDNKFIGYSDKTNQEVIIEKDIVKPILKGEDVKKYSPLRNTYFCIYPHFEKNGKTVPYEEDYFRDNFPLAYTYMLPFKNELIEKKIRYKTNPTAWYSLHRSRELSLFLQEKIITPEISLGTNMTYDNSNFFHNTKCYSLVKKDNIGESLKFWLAILNSRLLWFYLSNVGYVLRGGFFTFKTKYLEPFPLPKIDNASKQVAFIEKVDLLLTLKCSFQEVTDRFQGSVKRKFELGTLSKKLQDWYKLSYADFIKELSKQKIKFTLSEEAEWADYFDQEKSKALEIQSKIASTDKEIDQMVYELYSLSEEEIAIIENTK